MSGLTFGFTGSYIFSQTIFTYRTGVHSRWIGFLIMIVFMYIVASPVNILQISPLFFLGSTLIFIGYDLLYEWLIEIRHQVFLSEYGIVWFSFCAIQVVGINDGILLGVLIAILEQVILNAQTSNINRVQKNSRAVWTPADTKILHDHAYSPVWPKIVTLEVIGTVFFGSSLSLLNGIIEEIGLGEDDRVVDSATSSPHTSSHFLTSPSRSRLLERMAENQRGSPVIHKKKTKQSSKRRKPPKYLVLDLMNVSNLDASATRGCFLQLVKMCAKRNIIVCASGSTPRIEWMFRSHGVSISTAPEEEAFKARLLSRNPGARKRRSPPNTPVEKLLLFVTVQEALEFCETSLIHDLNILPRAPSLSTLSQFLEPESRTVSSVLSHILGATGEVKGHLERFEDGRYHDELDLKAGELVFQRETHPDCFFIVLRGCVANSTSSSHVVNRQKEVVITGAGVVSPQRVLSSSNLFDEAFLEQHGHDEVKSVATVWPVGGVFGYLDYLLERPRVFRAIATLERTRVARFTHSHMNLMQTEDPVLYGLMQRVLLHASTLDLMNCTCNDV